MGFYWLWVPLVLLYLIVTPVCRALVPEISLKSNNHVHPAAKSSVTTGNDVISETRTLGVGKWPTLNITRVRTSSTTTKLAIDDRNFDVVDPDPSSGLSYTIHHLDANSNPSGTKKRKKKTRHRNKWNHHSPSSKFGMAAAKTTPAGQPFWTQNDILESPTTKPPPTYSAQYVMLMTFDKHLFDLKFSFQVDAVDLPIFDVDLPALSAAGTAQRIRRPLVSVSEMGVCHRHDGRRSTSGRLGRIGKVAGIFQRLQRTANRHEPDVPAPDSSQTRQTSRHSPPGAEGHHLVRPHPFSPSNQSAVTQQRRRKPKDVLIIKTSLCFS